MGIAGSPGAGKSTVAKEVAVRLNALWLEKKQGEKDDGEIAVAVPMDGFHLYRHQLDAMEVKPHTLNRLYVSIVSLLSMIKN